MFEEEGLISAKEQSEHNIIDEFSDIEGKD
jgi:hypothetical protein